MLQMCGEVHEDDGIDPREYFKSRQNHQKINRKALQLCQQVAQVLHLVTSDCDDPWVQAMNVTMVTPNPDSSCLRVHVECDADCTIDQALEAIRIQSPRLRFEISRSIYRKRVPNLVFSVSMASEGENHASE